MLKMENKSYIIEMDIPDEYYFLGPGNSIPSNNELPNITKDFDSYLRDFKVGKKYIFYITEFKYDEEKLEYNRENMEIEGIIQKIESFSDCGIVRFYFTNEEIFETFQDLDKYGWWASGEYGVIPYIKYRKVE
jgi:hypothetical protein